MNTNIVYVYSAASLEERLVRRDRPQRQREGLRHRRQSGDVQRRNDAKLAMASIAMRSPARRTRDLELRNGIAISGISASEAA